MALSWEEMFEKASEYYKENGHLYIPISYVCSDGTKLGVWLNTQRAVNNGIRPGIMDASRKSKLESIGIDWEPNTTAWNKGYRELKLYKDTFGDINVPLRYSAPSGFRLGLWLQNQRRAFLKKGRGALSQAQILLLEDLDIVWDPYYDQWLYNYSLLEEYYKENGNVDIPSDYSVNGVHLGAWLLTQRQTYNGFGKGKISAKQIELLEKLNVDWRNKLDVRWQEMYEKATAYYETYGHLSVLSSYRTPDNYSLGTWIATQRLRLKDGLLDPTRVKLLDEIGMIWEPQGKAQTSFYEQALFFYLSKVFPDAVSRDRSTGIEFDVYIPSTKTAIEYDGQLFHSEAKSSFDAEKEQFCLNRGITLYRIRERECMRMLNETNHIYLVDNSISDVEEALSILLRKMGQCELDIDINRDSGQIYAQYLMVGPPINGEDPSPNYLISTEWYDFYTLACAFYSENGHLLIHKNEKYNGRELGKWVSNQRHYYNSKQTTLATQKIKLLENIGMIWNTNAYRWEQGFYWANKYYLEFGHLNVPSACVYCGYPLGRWVQNQKSKHTGKYKTAGKLSEDQCRRLESIGIMWKRNYL